MPRLGPTELIIIMVIVMMLFGVGRLPQVGSTLGKAIREFRRSQEDVEEAVSEISVSANGTSSEKKDSESTS